MLHRDEPQNDGFQRVYRQHADAVYRVCYGFMKNSADAEDAVQEAFLKFLRTEQRFESENHERAWLIVTASNICKNSLKSWTRQKREDVENTEDLLPAHCDREEVSPVLEAVLDLPEKYKTVIYLYYYEEYSCREIASVMGKKESSIRSLLKRGRAFLEKKLGGDTDEK
ncbi:MAG: RNA polymerase sigma factor [Ruminococcus sp.]